MEIEQILVCTSAGVILMLGSLHLVFTFFGPKLRPRKPEVAAAMENDHPGLSRQTTMWRAWVGFNASHSMGAMLFGLIYGYLAVEHSTLLFSSPFLLAVGATMLASFALLAVRYWFSVPRNGILLALGCYLAAIIAANW